jgi:hypothetical protein
MNKTQHSKNQLGVHEGVDDVCILGPQQPCVPRICHSVTDMSARADSRSETPPGVWSRAGLWKGARPCRTGVVVVAGH